MNRLQSDSESLDWRFKDVITPNADTPYSSAGLDLRAEPYVPNPIAVRALVVERGADRP